MNSKEVTLWLAPLINALRATAEVEVPAALDHRVRTTIANFEFKGRAFSSPLVALGLASAATLAITVGLALPLAAAGAAEQGLGMAVGIVLAYLALSSVVLLPLLMRTVRHPAELAR